MLISGEGIKNELRTEELLYEIKKYRQVKFFAVLKGGFNFF